MDELHTARSAIELAPPPTPTPVPPYPPASDLVEPLPIVASVLAAAHDVVPAVTPLARGKRRRRRRRVLTVAIIAGAIAAASLWHQGRRPWGYTPSALTEPPAATVPLDRAPAPLR
jgi:hypothetical protein